MREGFAPLCEWLAREDDFAIIAHVSPDGDTLGAGLALYMMLTARGKRAQVLCEHAVPAIYAFLPCAHMVTGLEAANPHYRNAIAVDCAAEDRMGKAAAVFHAADERANIDHHGSNNGYGGYVFVDKRASATGENIFLIYEAWRESFDSALRRDIAVCLFVAVSTDTGNFAYSSTTPATLRVAAALMEEGIDIAQINRDVYKTISLGKARLQGFVLSTMRFFCENRIGVACVALSDIKRLGAMVEDLEGMTDSIRDVDGVEIAIVLREKREGGWKASLRSKRRADVSALASGFGGGGHKHAAGCSTQGEMDTFYNALLRAAEQALH
ncbi:MAG: DHH family phosphoesterase [Clostridiales bacterium]|jgi:phosphoesterase RecJ-like protein|nr:DHH family phosphoesterase [Clostridiales bacterium]